MMAGVLRCVLLMLMLMLAFLWGYSEAVGGAKSRVKPQRPKHKETKIEPVDQEPTQNINLQQMTGKWFLLNVASKCPSLMKRGANLEPTFITLSLTSDPDKTIAVSTKTRHNHECWEILQVYNLTPISGRLILNGTQERMNTKITIKDTDYTNYAIIHYRKYDKETMKLYSRVTDDLSEVMLTRFEDQAEKKGFGLAFHFAPPTYSHCGETAPGRVINCVPTC